ncbi:MAG TPA: metallophosphoesterase [Bryobacteraceae bacterium]|nr:metallophosphoesterase [Bryobacteraceae bacterium]
MTRRDLLKTGVMASAGAICANAAESQFSFVHFTDTHIQPELRGAEGCRLCFDRINRTHADFALCGGDLVFDAAAQERPRAGMLYELYRETLKRVEMPVHSAIGNHDVFGTELKSGTATSDPEYGKKMYEDRIGKRYYSFDHKGWRFIVLDSILLGNAGGFTGGVDDLQLDWLHSELAHLDRNTPLVVMTHVPLISGALQIVPDAWATPATYLVGNVRRVLELLWPYNLKAVLQGHTHIRETVVYNGCQFITSGAVCGNWWKGARLGHPEGFGVLTVRAGEISWRYETYGFRASA